MKKPMVRIFFRYLLVVLIAALLINLPGTSIHPAHALTTTIDDIAGGGVAIPDPASGASCTTSVNRTLNVPTNFQIADLNVGINISHDRRSDVRVTLTSPAGTTVALISGEGLGSPVIASPDDNDNYDVLLDDSSINSLYDNGDDTVGAPLYDRDARPSESLNAFKTENAAGNWILSICDMRNGNAGTYNSARLIFTSADPNTITGTVFTDFNDNGIRSQSDEPVAGVVVTAYDDSNAVVATDTTDANGNYSLNILDGTLVRVEFSNIPSDLRPGAVGIDSGTTVQFVTSPAAGVDLGLTRPDAYCQDNPFLTTSCYINGDPLIPGGSASTADVLVSIPYSAYGRQDNTQERPLATGIQIGATWGLAIQRATGILFAGALAKRHTGFGPLGAGGIYTIQIDPNTGAALSVSNFVDISSLGIPVGTLGTNAARGLPAVSSTPNTDATAWDAVGKAAIGDIDMGSNDDTLWLVNLTNQTLYSIVVGNPATTPTNADVSAYPISLPAGATACPVNDIRPWAVHVFDGEIYVGVVCSAESTQSVNNLRAYVLRTNELSPGVFTLVFEMALNYPRGLVSSDTPTGFPAEWRPWTPTMTSLCASPCTGAGSLSFGKQIIYPQPILSDIEFDVNGDLILGFMDRAGHQTGNANYATSNPWGTVTLYDKDTNYTPTTVTITSTTQVYEGTSAGDLIRACVAGGSFVLENNASCGSLSSAGFSSNPAQGPGGGEFYWQDMYPPGANKNGGTHNEITLGGIALFAGTGEVVVSIFDPFELRSGGLAWFSNVTGMRSRAYEIFGIDQGGGATTFGKAAGLGDVEAFCFYAPIEIGNRVWLDENGDGIQTPGEPVLAGVTVEIYENGVLIATAVTDANGNYYFSSGPGTSSSSHVYALDELNPNSTYEIRIPNAQGPNQQTQLAGLILTPNDTDADQRDSDATLTNAEAVITIITGNPGDNNHTYDFGFTPTYSLGNRVWMDDGAGGGSVNNGLQDGSEVGIDGVVVNLYADTNGDGTPDGSILATSTTSAGGFYMFNDLPAGQYIVEVAASNFTGSGPLVGLISSSIDETSPDADIDLTDNGIGTYPDATNGVRSGTVTLGPGTVEPIGENNPTPNPLPGEAPDERSNRTVDFGFVLSQMSKSISGSDLVSTTNPEVTIGEIITFQVLWNIPPGTYTNLTLVDTMERGLAFVACDSIDAANLTTNVAGGFPSICSNPTTDSAGGGTTTDIDRRVTFNFGTLTNSNQTDTPITITYRAIVLDIDANVTGTELNNSALWAWDNGSLGPAQSIVQVVEPELVIEKTSDINFIAEGTEVTFSLTIMHSSDSQTDAYDVVIQDVLPTGVDYVDNTLDCDDGEQDPVSCTYDPATRTISAEWDTFTLLPTGDRGIIRFRIVGNSSLPANGNVTNIGSVTWSSKPGDQTAPQSYSNPANPAARERHYNPNNTVDVYGDDDSLTLTPLGGGGGNGGNNPAAASVLTGFAIAGTGFAPGIDTELNAVNRPAYNTTDLSIMIPSIHVDEQIVGVKLQKGYWDVSFLWNQVGWLESTAYPTWTGNSVVTAHVTNADGKPGTFSKLKGLKAGSYIFVYNSGYRYVYKVVSNQSVKPNDIHVLKHEEKAYLTLITCDRFDNVSSTYLSRIVVRAVLVDVEPVE